MAVTYPRMKNGMYYGRMDDDTAELILDTRKKDVIPGLTQKIFEFPPSLILRSLEEGRSIRRIIKEEGIDYTEFIGKLRDYQTTGTGFMYLSPRSMIADGVGMGKTAEVAALLNFLKERNQLKRFIIAVETSALGQTQCDLIRFTGLHIIQMPSEAEKMKRVINNTDWNFVDGIVMKHSGLRADNFSRWLSLNLDENGMSRIFNVFILDESSVIKNTGTKIYNYTENICNIVTRVHYMNATAFEIHIMDIYNQFDMMDKELLPKPWRIQKEYCTYGTKTYWTSEKDPVTGLKKPKMNYAKHMCGYKNQEKFKESLKLFYFGRSKAEVGMDRPHTYRVYEVEPTNEQSLALSKGYRYMEVLNCPSAIKELNIPCDREHVPKLERLMQLVENDFVDDKIMVYCFHLDAQAAIAEEMKKAGRNPVILNGADTDEERYNKMLAFNKGDVDVLITNIKKSLNLYGGDVCIFYTVETNPAKMEQIRGRIDRNVDESTKTYVLLVYKGTDEYRFLTEVVSQRAEDARSLTIDSKTAIDYFMEAMPVEAS